MKFWRGHDPSTLKYSLRLVLNKNYFLSSDLLLLLLFCVIDLLFLRQLRIHMAFLLGGVCSTVFTQYLGNSLIITSNKEIVGLVQNLDSNDVEIL